VIRSTIEIETLRGGLRSEQQSVMSAAGIDTGAKLVGSNRAGLLLPGLRLTMRCPRRDQRCSRCLGVPRTTLNAMMRKLGITRKDI
jgi:hypothetical protein